MDVLENIQLEYVDEKPFKRDKLKDGKREFIQSLLLNFFFHMLHEQ